LLPGPEQAAALAEHSRHARFAWNLARRDWVEKTTTDVARRFDTIRVEDLYVPTMTRSARNADVNAARNIAAGRAVTARGDLGTSRSANREPQLCSPAALWDGVEIR